MRGTIKKEGSDTMDHSYIDIEARIRDANQQRSEALGKLIAAGWVEFKRLMTDLRHRRTSRNTVEVHSSAFIGSHYLP